MSKHRVPWLELIVLRKKDGHTQTSLAKAAGVSRPYITLLENGDREPDATITKTLAVTLNVPVSVLDKRPHGSIYLPEELEDIYDSLREPEPADEAVSA